MRETEVQLNMNLRKFIYKSKIQTLVSSFKTSPLARNPLRALFSSVRWASSKGWKIWTEDKETEGSENIQMV